MENTTEITNQLAAIVDFVNAHAPCRAELANKVLIVSTDAVCPEGHVERVQETIPATLKAARDWLGY